MRIFYAIPLDTCAQAKLYNLHNYRECKSEIERVVSGENLHITLTFIGEVEDVTPYLEILDLVKMNTFQLQTQDTMQYFRDTLVIALQKHNDILVLKQTIDTLLKEKQLLPEKRYNYIPHVTLARKARGEIFKNPILDICVDKVVLYQSILNGNRVEYRIMREVNLLKE